MERQAYKVLKEVHDILTRDKRLIVSAQDLSYIIGAVRTLLTIYADDVLQEAEPVEARRAPKRPEKVAWYAKILG